MSSRVHVFSFSSITRYSGDSWHWQIAFKSIQQLTSRIQVSRAVTCILPTCPQGAFQHVFTLYLLGKLIRNALSMLDDDISGQQEDSGLKKVAHCITGMYGIRSTKEALSINESYMETTVTRHR
ncbi:hypothetical protein O0I10_007012 [Lichtheimia ornata]|uniref:Uncharacterized protein n=1 Tax=Lichtheimia ornata TaxID=688661 RepID=A0AAD7V293_9FUNG|nr:uncharacterized protein O0I10_007012 [Lichtheimia ornata]KAJ8657196.1 hypothetical protein O0I10_007012 [Lichtheimia ornata]